MIHEGSYVEIRINGEQLPTASNVFRKAILQCGYGLNLPVAMFEFEDRHNILTGNLALVDGTTLSVTLGDTKEDSVTYDFSCVSNDEQVGTEGIVISVYAILKNAKLYAEAATEAYIKKNSTDAMREIADQCGLDFKGPEITPKDVQDWHNIGMPRSQHFAHILNRSYIGENDALTGAIDFDSVRVTEAIASLQREPRNKLIWQQHGESDTDIIIDQIQSQNRSGVTNHALNYGFKFYQDSATGDEIVRDSIQPDIIGEALNMSQELKGSVSQSRLAKGKFFDTGRHKQQVSNIHDNYYEAPYTRLRILSLFTNTLRVSTRTFNNIPLMSVVDVVTHTEKDGQSEFPKYDGKYHVGGKTLMVVPSYYIEAYDLYRSFINIMGNTSSVGGASPASESASSTSGNSPSATNESTANSNLDVTTAVLEMALDKETTVNTAIEMFNHKVDDLNSKFKEASKSLGFPELEAKWGENADFLLAIGAEISAIKNKLDYCKPLNDIQKLSVNILKIKGPVILDQINSRLQELNGALEDIDSFMSELGRFNGSSVDSSITSIECGEEMSQAINDVVSKGFNDACLDNLAFEALQTPRLGLLSSTNKLERILNDMVCAGVKSLY